MSSAGSSNSIARRMRVLSIVGARPQFVKLGPVSRAMAGAHESFGCSIDEKILHTGQHYDESMSEAFFRELAITPPDVNLGVGSGSHGAQTAKMLEGIEAELIDTSPDAVVIYGDTNSTLAGALAAAKLNIPVAHVEAGLRSFDREMPEEVNRIVADHVSDLLLAPTSTAMKNLADENLAGRAQLVGDVMLDAAFLYGGPQAGSSDLRARLDLGDQGFAVATIHRAANTEPGVLAGLLETLNGISASAAPVVFPVHPRTQAIIKRHLNGWQPDARLHMIEPVGYLDMLRLLDSASVVLTDSGGLQKEAFFSGVRCITLREETEWTETVELGGNVIVGNDTGRIESAVAEALADGLFRGSDGHREGLQLYGGGKAAERIVESLVNKYGFHGE